MGTTTKYALRWPAGTGLVKDGDDRIKDLADDVDAQLTPYSGGTLAARPVSTPGSPGKAGRTYLCTDDMVLYRDYGTGWIAENPRWETFHSCGAWVLGTNWPASDLALTALPGGVTYTGPTTNQYNHQQGMFRVDPADFPNGAKMRCRVTIANSSGQSQLSNACTVDARTITLSGTTWQLTGGSVPVTLGVTTSAQIKQVVSSAAAILTAGLYLPLITIFSSGMQAGSYQLAFKVDYQWTPNPLAS